MNSSRAVCFDQRMEEFVISTKRGFIIYDYSTGVLLYEAIFPGGGAKCISILSDSNIIVVSGDDSRDGFTSNSIVLWDRENNKVISLFMVKNPIFALEFRLDCIIISHGNEISFYDSYDFTEKYSFKHPKPNSICFATVPLNTIFLT